MKIQDIYTWLRPYWKRIVMIIISSFFVSIITAIIPIVNSHMIDEGLIEQKLNSLCFFVLLIFLLQAADKVLQYFQTKQEVIISNLFNKNLKTKVLEHGFRLKPNYIQENGFYKTVSNALYDVSNLVLITTNNFFIILVIVCKAIAAAVGLFIIDWALALFIMTLIPIKILINIYIRKHAEQLNQKLLNANKSYNSWFSNLLSGMIDIKLWDLEKRKVEESKEQIEQINIAAQNLSLLSAKNAMITNILEAGYLNFLYIIGGILILNHNLSLGNLFAVISFSSYLLVPVNAIMDLRIILKQITPNIDSIKKFFALEEENYKEGLLPEKNIEKIDFKNVSVQIGGNNILKNINFTIKKGSKVAIIGANGSGKTTILNLLLRLREPSQGEICFNEIPISQYNVEEYRKKFSVVTQNIHLFSGSVRENVVFDNAKDFGICREAKFCEDTMKGLEKGLDTQVGIDGTKVSGGEKQKIALARALNRKTDILILDEATASYDRESILLFSEFLEKNQDYDYYFIVSHQTELIEKANIKIYLSHGEMADIEENAEQEEIWQ